MRIKFIKTTTDVYLTLNSVKHTSGSCWYLANKLVLCKWCVFFSIQIVAKKNLVRGERDRKNKVFYLSGMPCALFCSSFLLFTIRQRFGKLNGSFWNISSRDLLCCLLSCIPSWLAWRSLSSLLLPLTRSIKGMSRHFHHVLHACFLYTFPPPPHPSP